MSWAYWTDCTLLSLALRGGEQEREEVESWTCRPPFLGDGPYLVFLISPKIKMFQLNFSNKFFK